MFDLGRSFLATVERSPRAVAIVDGEQRLTYAEWYAEICRVTRHAVGAAASIWAEIEDRDAEHPGLVGEIVLYARAGKDDDPDLQHFQHGVVALERHLRHLAAG
jgi:non-ribosomal peptide synthetase component F